MTCKVISVTSNVALLRLEVIFVILRSFRPNKGIKKKDLSGNIQGCPSDF